MRAGGPAAGSSHERVPDAVVARLAARRSGVVTRAELGDAGLGKKAIAARVADGRLTRLHRGVYVVGAVAGPRALEIAALLACGGAAVLSHHTAAALWGFSSPVEAVHVIVARHRRGRAGLVVHELALERRDVRRRERLPVTSPARTLLDLAATVPRAQLERAADTARAQRLTIPEELHSLLARSPTHRGAAALTRLLSDDTGFTRSDAERRLRALVKAAGLPAPRSNARIEHWEPDLLWPEHHLVVELDTWTFHSGREEFERDRRKDVALQLAGYRVLRITGRRLDEEPHGVVAQLATALATAPRPAAA